MSATDLKAAEFKATEFKDGLIREIPNLRAFAASLSGSMQLADDLVQDTLLKAWGNSEKFEPGTSLRAWLFTILRNTYYSLYRKRGREVQDSEGTYAERMATHGNQESHLDLADFRKALAKLPEEQREVLIMVGATGLSYEEAAEICGVAIGTIKSRVNRARTKLAELLSIGSVDDLGPDRTSAAAMQRIGSETV
ncbi:MULTISPECIES: sigma-70 family RNA polymerase sigma factor [unclassified Bosea (in: a-proteobacteria)]|uniref:sigma-70 family RNA polymerase sigma factor n=1 Tax=unclassified Bosea (in: a-proteobacteria) TaxID=2653178 RepID=UPI00095641B5|nr:MULTISPECIES: sigma-70 family RNA polymerase sigma factor [unclassified Bosea (in: a-proteobacteria)]TAJ33528.1 MAG: sigma-70 family RNA polymerase sigma factor [Bosea sp. (in: a-proteobacteria)]SIQ93091.1 RNA polymerase sigma-70 factor, ECF subfamily [Bosea sp. TND4EK4]